MVPTVVTLLEGVREGKEKGGGRREDESRRGREGEVSVLLGFIWIQLL
jgi:hypothetical protein